MQPGSFIDLLMRAKDKTTGQGFTDLEIANQVALVAHTFVTKDLPCSCACTLAESGATSRSPASQC